jgi:hypothetical protein
LSEQKCVFESEEIYHAKKMLLQREEEEEDL